VHPFIFLKQPHFTLKNAMKIFALKRFVKKSQSEHRAKFTYCRKKNETIWLLTNCKKRRSQKLTQRSLASGSAALTSWGNFGREPFLMQIAK
jgi:hypothetical protein